MKLFNPDFPLWGQAFRPMFLAAAGFSAFAMLLWGLSLSGMIRLPVDNPVFWHSHEMLFGFAMAVVAGFLLTAVQNWTGRRAVNGKPLLLLTLVWLSGRMAMLSSAFLPWWLIACIDMAFIPLVALFFWQLVFAVRQKRNYFFAPVLLLMLMFWLVHDTVAPMGMFTTVKVSPTQICSCCFMFGKDWVISSDTLYSPPSFSPLIICTKKSLKSFGLAVLVFGTMMLQGISQILSEPLSVKVTAISSVLSCKLFVLWIMTSSTGLSEPSTSLTITLYEPSKPFSFSIRSQSSVSSHSSCS